MGTPPDIPERGTAMSLHSFESWMALVDQAIIAKCGCSAYDLPDVPYQEWYEAGKSVSAAANKAIKSAKGDF